MQFNHKETYEHLHRLSGVSIQDLKATFDALGTYMILNFMEDKQSYIPYIGNLKTVYEGEDYISGTKKAKVSFEIEVDDMYIKNVGNAVDNNDTDIEKRILQAIGDELTSIISK